MLFKKTLMATFAPQRFCYSPLSPIHYLQIILSLSPLPYHLSTPLHPESSGLFYVVKSPCMSRLHSTSTADPLRRPPQSPHNSSSHNLYHCNLHLLPSLSLSFCVLTLTPPTEQTAQDSGKDLAKSHSVTVCVYPLSHSHIPESRVSILCASSYAAPTWVSSSPHTTYDTFFQGPPPIPIAPKKTPPVSLFGINLSFPQTLRALWAYLPSSTC